ncbi:MAG TPA: DNA starvation/stationary phase protection protein Dps [Polyangiaceae bacterium LLY-WYZ-14_1]|nr:DNA starvation/stationary phase protection protein Dps [Polyangiaceae bacterium LLY-WYZ-14_1]
MNTTKNTLPENVRTPMVKLLNERLAEAIDLHWQAKQAHWNVKGDSFIALHQLFDEISEHMDEHSDLLAERAVSLGGQAEGTIQVATKRSTLPEYPLEATDQLVHVDKLSTSLAAFGEHVRKGIDAADEVGDKDTADVLTEISRSIDKDLWFVEAHLNRG